MPAEDTFSVDASRAHKRHSQGGHGRRLCVGRNQSAQPEEGACAVPTAQTCADHVCLTPAAPGTALGAQREHTGPDERMSDTGGGELISDLPMVFISVASTV